MWKPTTKAKGWLESFKELEEYKDKHGTCMIPKQKKGSENRNLFLWVSFIVFLVCPILAGCSHDY
jgi:hypothetical protein